MIYRYFIKTNNRKFKSFVRYFQYLQERAILKINTFDQLNRQKTILLVSEEEKENQEFLKEIINNDLIKVIFIGCNDTCQINLLKLGELSIQIQELINITEYSIEPLFTHDELLSKAKQFFKGHGVLSLFNTINFVIYYLGNGQNLLIQEELTIEEYQMNFLRPGLLNWEDFLIRFNKNKYYLILLGNQKRIGIIEELLELISNKIDLLIKYNTLEGIKEHMNNSVLIIENLRRIDDIFVQINRDIENIGTEI